VHANIQHWSSSDLIGAKLEQQAIKQASKEELICTIVMQVVHKLAIYLLWCAAGNAAAVIIYVYNLCTKKLFIC
jgi:hypothetical protein